MDLKVGRVYSFSKAVVVQRTIEETVYQPIASGKLESKSAVGVTLVGGACLPFSSFDVAAPIKEKKEEEGKDGGA